MMQDPSQGVHPHLLPHLHLISSFRFPTIQNLNPEQALGFLLDAPKIIKEVTPVSWQYIANPPNDGFLCLAWQPPSRGQKFSSDGYIWADVEQLFRTEVRGYELEILIHRSGYRPNIDQLCCHSRHRIRIVGKSNSIGGPPADAHRDFWLVHYRRADAQSTIPANRISVSPEVQQLMQERRFLDSQQIQRKDFMFYDRASWPQVPLPQSVGGRPPMPYPHHAPPPGQHPFPGMPGRHPQYYPSGPGQPMPGPPAKRARQGPPPQVQAGGPVAPTAAAMGHDQKLEEDTTVGDYLDNLTPAEISRIRFRQHHEWLEEVFSSIYPVSNIIPEELGFGLVGELGELTRGLLNAPDPDDVLKAWKPDDPKNNYGGSAISKIPNESPKQYKKLSAAQMAEFEKRVAGYVEKKEAEMKELRAQHEKTMAKIRVGEAYVEAERKLKQAGINGDKIDQVIQDIEKEMDTSVMARKEVVCVQRGGLLDEIEKKKSPKPLEEAQDTTMMDVDDATATATTTNGAKDATTSTATNTTTNANNGNENTTSPSNAFGITDPNDDTAAGLLDEFTTTADFTPQGETETGNQDPAANEEGKRLDEDNSALDLIDSMDLDAPTTADTSVTPSTNMPAAAEATAADAEAVTGTEVKTAEDDWVVVEQEKPSAATVAEPSSSDMKASTLVPLTPVPTTTSGADATSAPATTIAPAEESASAPTMTSAPHTEPKTAATTGPASTDTPTATGTGTATGTPGMMGTGDTPGPGLMGDESMFDGAGEFGSLMADHTGGELDTPASGEAAGLLDEFGGAV